MGELDNSIVGKKPRQNITQGIPSFKEDKSMNGEQKMICVIVTCVAAVAICVACCLTYYNLTTFQQAIEAGLEQQQTGNSTIWIKSAK